MSTHLIPRVSFSTSRAYTRTITTSRPFVRTTPSLLVNVQSASSSSSPTFKSPSSPRLQHTHYSSTVPGATIPFSRFYASAAKSPVPPPEVAPENLAQVVKTPNPETLDPDDDVLDISQVKFGVTPNAAEQLRKIATRDNDPNVALRVFVESGGCHGYSTKIELTTLKDGDGDFHFIAPHAQPSNVLIDPMSLDLLKGSTLDFATELIGSSFKIVGNPQSGGGCGCGTSWEAKK